MNIRRSLVNLIIKNNLILGQRTTASQLSKFFNKLSPQYTGHELIRVGGENDGGYLIPNDLEGINSIFSPGVGNTAEFELHFASKGLMVYMADYSINCPPIVHPNFIFEKCFT